MCALCIGAPCIVFMSIGSTWRNSISVARRTSTNSAMRIRCNMSIEAGGVGGKIIPIPRAPNETNIANISIITCIMRYIPILRASMKPENMALMASPVIKKSSS